MWCCHDRLLLIQPSSFQYTYHIFVALQATSEASWKVTEPSSLIVAKPELLATKSYHFNIMLYVACTLMALFNVGWVAVQLPVGLSPASTHICGPALACVCLKPVFACSFALICYETWCCRSATTTTRTATLVGMTLQVKAIFVGSWLCLCSCCGDLCCCWLVVFAIFGSYGLWSFNVLCCRTQTCLTSILILCLIRWPHVNIDKNHWYLPLCACLLSCISLCKAFLANVLKYMELHISVTA